MASRRSGSFEVSRASRVPFGQGVIPMTSPKKNGGAKLSKRHPDSKGKDLKGPQPQPLLGGSLKAHQPFSRGPGEKQPKIRTLFLLVLETRVMETHLVF